MAERGGPNRRGTERAAWLGQVGREQENLRAALAWAARDARECGLRLAAALAPFWTAHGLIGEGRRALAAIMARAPGAERRAATRALAVAGFLALLDGDVDAGERACRESAAASCRG